MWIAADVRGAPSTSPAMPKMAPKPIVATRTRSGFMRSVAPNAIGWTMFCRRPFASRTMTSMISAVSVPSDPNARMTAKAPDTKAPMKGM